MDLLQAILAIGIVFLASGTSPAAARYIGFTCIFVSFGTKLLERL